MSDRFDYFVIFAEMRTGSNFLEANINNFKGLTCHGEAFNPAFIGYPNTDNILGISQKEREADPEKLIETIKSKTPGLGGFRFFSDHDGRVLDAMLADRRCAKIILTRNPVDSFVSLQIAKATGQWKLTNLKHARREKVHFEPARFADYLQRHQDFQVKLLNALQRSGQTAFYVAYEDLQDVAVMNGLAAFLGCAEQVEALDDQLKRQNPTGLEEKVENFAEMQTALAELDAFGLSRTPNFEPRRGPRVPHYVAAAKAPLLYLPLTGGPDEAIRRWFIRLDDSADVESGFTQTSLRKWRAANPGHRSFSVLRHPLARAHAIFCNKILSQSSGSLPDTRRLLSKHHGVTVPDFDPFRDPDKGYEDADHAVAFTAFLTFLRKNLSGQTGMRVDMAWASQFALLQGMADVAVPDMVVREERLEEDLAILCAQIGRQTMPELEEVIDPHRTRLARIVTDEMQDIARTAYQRDFEAFGFGDWVA